MGPGKDIFLISLFSKPVIAFSCAQGTGFYCILKLLLRVPTLRRKKVVFMLQYTDITKSHLLEKYWPVSWVTYAWLKLHIYLLRKNKNEKSWISWTPGGGWGREAEQGENMGGERKCFVKSEWTKCGCSTVTVQSRNSQEQAQENCGWSLPLELCVSIYDSLLIFHLLIYTDKASPAYIKIVLLNYCKFK